MQAKHIGNKYLPPTIRAISFLLIKPQSGGVSTTMWAAELLEMVFWLGIPFLVGDPFESLHQSAVQGVVQADVLSRLVDNLPNGIVYVFPRYEHVAQWESCRVKQGRPFHDILQGKGVWGLLI